MPCASALAHILPGGVGGYFLLGWQKVPGLESRAGAPQGAQVPKAAQIIPLGTCPHSRKGAEVFIHQPGLGLGQSVGVRARTALPCSASHPSGDSRQVPALGYIMFPFTSKTCPQSAVLLQHSFPGAVQKVSCAQEVPLRWRLMEDCTSKSAPLKNKHSP